MLRSSWRNESKRFKLFEIMVNKYSRYPNIIQNYRIIYTDNLGLASSDNSFNIEYFRFTADQVCHAERKFISRINFSIAGCLIFLALEGEGRGDWRKTGERSLFSGYEGKLGRGFHENPFKLERCVEK